MTSITLISAEEPDLFQYTPLQGEEQEIRLIRLLESEDEAISCCIQPFPLNDAPDYSALSYMWGDPARIHPLLANGRRLGITKSLKLFFQEVISRRRSASDSTGWPLGWLWIDAVSINQDDLIERSEQVAKMKEIYENAHAMVIWLGEASAGSNGAIELLKEIAALEDEEPELSDGDVPGITCRFGNAESFVETTYVVLAAVTSVMNSTYWDRAWIIQEASTPKGLEPGNDKDQTTWVCCGSMTIPWSAYAKANKRLIHAAWGNKVRHHIDLHDVGNTNAATVKYMEDRRRAEVFRNTLYPMMVRSRTSDATNPRDKLYAVLGLIDERDAPGLQPDYTLSVEEVYTRLAKTLVSRNDSLDCLGSAGLVRDHEVPSWVPDWTVQHDRTPQPFYQTDQTWKHDGTIKSQSNIFNTSKNMIPEVAFDRMDRRLVARGFCFDIVKEVSLPRPWPDETPDIRWQNWVSVANPGTSNYISGCSRFEAFEKTLKADFSDVSGDWSAERGANIEGFTDPAVNVFELHDGIVDAMTWHRRLFITSKGYMGLAPAATEPNDKVCILFGSQMPMLLREEGDHWSFVGQAYVHGIMDGEAIDGIDVESQSRQFEVD